MSLFGIIDSITRKIAWRSIDKADLPTLSHNDLADKGTKTHAEIEAAITAETAARSAGDTAITSNLSAEISNRIAADASLSNSITAETNNRINDVATEAAARSASDTNLYNMINSIKQMPDGGNNSYVLPVWDVVNKSWKIATFQAGSDPDTHYAKIDETGKLTIRAISQLSLGTGTAYILLGHTGESNLSLFSIEQAEGGKDDVNVIRFRGRPGSNVLQIYNPVSGTPAIFEGDDAANTFVKLRKCSLVLEHLIGTENRPAMIKASGEIDVGRARTLQFWGTFNQVVLVPIYNNQQAGSRFTPSTGSMYLVICEGCAVQNNYSGRCSFELKFEVICNAAGAIAIYPVYTNYQTQFSSTVAFYVDVSVYLGQIEFKLTAYDTNGGFVVKFGMDVRIIRT